MIEISLKLQCDVLNDFPISKLFFFFLELTKQYRLLNSDLSMCILSLIQQTKNQLKQCQKSRTSALLDKWTFKSNISVQNMSKTLEKNFQIIYGNFELPMYIELFLFNRFCIYKLIKGFVAPVKFKKLKEPKILNAISSCLQFSFWKCNIASINITGPD